MPPPPNLPAALLRHTAADPEEPWLFRAEGWDWVWHPWRELAGWLEHWRAALSSLPPGSRAAFPFDSRPESVILDLAIQAAGLVSAPGERREADFWIERQGLEIETSPPVPLSHCPRTGRERGDVGGAVVRIGGEEVEWTSEELIAAGERLQGEIGDAGGRDVVVLGGPLENSLERSMLAWATLSGAAVVLEPDPVQRVATAAWVRPTVFHGTPSEIAELRARARKARKGRLPFRRLRAVLVAGTLPEEEEAFWRERGVRVERLEARSLPSGKG